MFDDIEFNIKEYPIGGKMVTGKCIVTDAQYMDLRLSDDDLKLAIKKDLAKQLALLVQHVRILPSLFFIKIEFCK